jgi:hypothetical protein
VSKWQVVYVYSNGIQETTNLEYQETAGWLHSTAVEVMKNKELCANGRPRLSSVILAHN